MNIVAIRAALEKRLATITPALDTAFEGVEFEPVTGTPYQRVDHLTSPPVDHAVTLDVIEERGIFQVSLFYPLGNGSGDAMARAELIRATFKPALYLVEGAVKVEIRDTPHIGKGMPDDGRYMVPISIRWQSFTA